MRCSEEWDKKLVKSFKTKLRENFEEIQTTLMHKNKSNASSKCKQILAEINTNSKST